MNAIPLTIIGTIIEINTDKLCLIGTISFVHFKFGIFRFTIRPNNAENVMDKIGVMIISKDITTSLLDKYIHTSDTNKEGIPVNIRCIFTFAFNISSIFTGRDLANHSVFPSREIEGAVMSLKEANVHIASTISGASNVASIPSCCNKAITDGNFTSI